MATIAKAQISSPVKSFYRDPTAAKAGRDSRSDSSQSEPRLLSEEATAVYLADLSPENKKKLRRLIVAETKRLGYSQTREGGPTWEKCQRHVISNLVAHEVDLDEIHFEDAGG